LRMTPRKSSEKKTLPKWSTVIAAGLIERGAGGGSAITSAAGGAVAGVVGNDALGVDEADVAAAVG